MFKVNEIHCSSLVLDYLDDKDCIHIYRGNKLIYSHYPQYKLKSELSVSKILENRQNLKPMIMKAYTCRSNELKQLLEMKQAQHMTDFRVQDATLVPFNTALNEFQSIWPKTLTNLDITSEGYQQKVKDLPSTVTNLTLPVRYKITEGDTIPPSILSLKLGYRFNQRIDNLFTHTNITDLDLSNCGVFNYPIDNMLPPLLKELKLGKSFNQPLINLPKSLTYLNFDYSHSEFQQYLELPPNLTNLSLGVKYNKQLNFPSSLTSLRFGARFNQTLTKPLPANLTRLGFGDDFNQPLNNDVLPTNLTELSFGKNFNQRIDNLNCNKLKHLAFYGSDFNQSIDKLPSSITKLYLSDKFNQSIDKLPISLRSLSLGCNFNQSINKLPDNLYFLQFLFYRSLFNHSVDHLSKNLKILIFCDTYNLPIDHLPTNLIHLTVGASFNQPLDNLPPNLLTLTFSGTRPLFNHTIDKLPSTLKKLSFKSLACFNHPINNLPNNLTHLELGEGFNQELIKLPNTLKSIQFLGSDFNNSLDHVPDSVEEIIFDIGCKFNQPINHYPAKLKFLQLPDKSAYSHSLANKPESVELVWGRLTSYDEEAARWERV